MKQTIFETRHRAEELLREAIQIWEQSDRSDFLEGLDEDPVFSLLMTALAYQANEVEDELEHMKNDVLEDFARMLTPYEVGHAIPATVVIETALQSGLPEVELTERHTFMMSDSNIQFMPLLRTRVLNASVRSVVRIDGRRWKVSLAFDMPITDLSGFCFTIKNQNFRDLKLSLKGKLLPLIKPWDFSELPLSPCFSIDTILYNRTQTYAASSTCLDLFAKQNVRMFCIKNHQATKYLASEVDSIDLIFEFTGIPDSFIFDKESLSLNSVILVNAQQHTVNLSSSNPIVRVAGYQSASSDSGTYAQQFLHMLRPSDDQIFGSIPIEVRKIAADRFNQGSLLRLLSHMIGKYYTDFYAFQNIQDEANEKVMHNLLDILVRMRDSANDDSEHRVPGVYLMLRPQMGNRNQQIELGVSYVTTHGAAVNSQLKADSSFKVPTGFDASATRQIANPVPGSDEIRDEKGEASLVRYYMTTNDRLVTPADMKLFCYIELQTRFGITRNMIKNITVSQRQELEKRQSGYEILVEIVLIDSSFIRRGFEEKISQTEILLKSMMNVRSTNIYPIQVVIKIEK